MDHAGELWTGDACRLVVWCLTTLMVLVMVVTLVPRLVMLLALWPGLAGAASTAAVYTLHHPTLLEFLFGHAADAVGGKVGVAGLDAAEAAEVLVALLLPLGDEVAVGDLLLQAVVVEFSGDGLAAEEEVEHVAGLLVVDLEDGPEGLHLTLSLVRLRLRFAHFLVQLIQSRLN